MRKVDKNFNVAPKELINCAENNEKELLENRHVIGNCYKKSRSKLEELYFEKCAYCETEYLKNTDTWVEHYRPQSVYYWLAYEWSNLIPTCPKCNRIKKAKFPLINSQNRIVSPPVRDGRLDKEKCKADCNELIGELPYVLHPEIDNPEEFLDFELDKNKKGIEITGIDILGRGKNTTEICNLNRESLMLDRQSKVIDNIIQLIEFLLHTNVKEGLTVQSFTGLFSFIVRKLKEDAKNEKLEHTLLRKTILKTNKFEQIVCPYIKNVNQRKIVIKAFKKFCSN
jgi:uncharacterized protein (TIGR02646 family)